MKILDSPLMGEFIGYLRANWSVRSRVDQRRRRLRQLVAMVRAVADAAECRGGAAVRDGSLSAWLHVLRGEALRGQEVLDAAGCDAAAVAGSARRFLSGLRALFVCSAEVDRLTEAVEELERLAGPGGDLQTFVQVLRLDGVRATEMDIDGRPAPSFLRGQEATSAGSAAAGAKRKHASTSDLDGGSSSQATDTVERRKRRVVAWARPHQWLPGFGGLFAAPQEQPTPPPPPVAFRSRRARAVALAMARVRRRIGKPTGRPLRRSSLEQRLSRMSL